MTLRELLQKTLNKGYYDRYTLIIQHYGKVEGENLDREYYTDTPVFDKFSYFNKEDLDKYIVLIPFHCPFDIGRNWRFWDNLQIIVVTTKEELLKQYCKEQLEPWLQWLDKEVRKEVLIHKL